MVLSVAFGPPLGGRGARLAAQVSPGPLARAHAELEGTLKCTRCHGGGKDAMQGRCLNCHKDIAWLAERGRGLHGAQDVKGAPCASCHPDHAGKEFALVRWPEGSSDRFDHRRAGWPLTQSHVEARCDKCHAVRFQASPAVRLRAPGSATGWTGLERGCTSCHVDVHRGALEPDCTSCHDAGKWTVTPGFDHDTTAYPLTNRHAEVKCDKCHLAARLAPKQDREGHLIPVYRPVRHESCTSCHDDVHKGQFGGTCTKCHSTAGWKQIDKNRFDHDQTRYPLRGKHAAIKCAGCHRDFSTPALKKPAYQTCGTCHQDVHNRTATFAGLTVDCDKCHGLSGFSPSTFTAEQHRNTRYALEGKHLTVRCASCHRKDPTPSAATKWGSAKVIIRPAYARCLDCHTDDHGGQLAARAGKGECADCHRVLGWQPSTFDRVTHAKLRLPLDGRHADVECRACHGAERAGLRPLRATALGKAKFLFKVSELECSACHADPHKGRFATGGPRAKEKGCLACHDARSFRPSTAGVAAHAGFGFALDGAHRATACVACHEEMKQPPATRRSSLIAGGTSFSSLSFAVGRKECGDCHEDPHGNQFANRQDGGRCDACHGPEAFRPASRFDHDRQAAFPLRGGHEAVPCNQCHPTDLKGGTAQSLIFRPVPGKCESCHGEESR